MNEGLGSFVRLSPAIWPGAALAVQPGDLTQFAPMGMGLGGPLVMMPGDTLEDVMRRPGYYSYHPHNGHPLRGAPVTEAGGGVVYFDDRPAQADMESLFRMLEVRASTHEFVAFHGSATNAESERYLVQLRVMTHSALAGMYGAAPRLEGQPLPKQEHSLGETLWRFIQHQQAYYGDRYSAGLAGCLGGDGDWARESLCFGFLVENSYYGIYRIWSRAWLVTK